MAGNPRHLATLARAEYRRCVGIPGDRRAQPDRISLPINLNINLTRQCNLRCEMCIQHRHDGHTSNTLSWYDPQRELPLAGWVRLLDQAAAFRPTLYVTGGEPMVYPKFGEFIVEAKRRGLFVQLATNGTLLARHAKLLVERGVEMVTVSLDGPADVHDRIRRQRGSFEHAAEGIRALVAARKKRQRPVPLVGLNFTISKDNVAVIGDMVPLAVGLEADLLQFQHTIFSSQEHVASHNRVFSPEFTASRGITMVPPSIPSGEFYEGGLSAEQVPAVIAAFKRARSQSAGRIRLSFLPSLSSEMIALYYGDLDHPFGGRCDVPWKTLRILPDGTVSPCLHVVAGNISEQSLDEIWNGPSMRNYRRLIAQNLLPGCVRCCSRSFCMR
jgi:radical SAM protein with 4Fe4S-binding SPASM domain